MPREKGSLTFHSRLLLSDCMRTQILHHAQFPAPCTRNALALRMPSAHKKYYIHTGRSIYRLPGLWLKSGVIGATRNPRTMAPGESAGLREAHDPGLLITCATTCHSYTPLLLYSILYGL